MNCKHWIRIDSEKSSCRNIGKPGNFISTSDICDLVNNCHYFEYNELEQTEEQDSLTIDQLIKVFSDMQEILGMVKTELYNKRNEWK